MPRLNGQRGPGLCLLPASGQGQEIRFRSTASSTLRVPSDGPEVPSAGGEAFADLLEHLRVVLAPPVEGRKVLLQVEAGRGCVTRKAARSQASSSARSDQAKAWQLSARVPDLRVSRVPPRRRRNAAPRRAGSSCGLAPDHRGLAPERGPDAVAAPHEEIADAVLQRDDPPFAGRVGGIGRGDPEERCGLRVTARIEVARGATQGVPALWLR
jgi:hypothetical protein